MSGASATEVHPDGRRDPRRTATPARWHADAFQDAVWESRTLSLKAKALAVTYARHARDEAGERTPAADLAWLTYERAMAQTSIGKRTAIAAAAKELVDGGWLVAVRVVARRPTIYRLAIPDPAASSPVGTSSKGTTGAPDVPTGELRALPGSSQTGPGSSLSESGSSHGGTSVVPTGERNLSSKSTSPPSSARALAAVAEIAARTGADDDEALALIEKIEAMARGGLRTTARAYVRAMPDEDLVELLAQLRVARPPAGRPRDNRPHSRPASRPAWREDLAARQATTAELAERSRRGAALVAAELARRSQPHQASGPAVSAWDQLVALTTT